VWVVRLIISSGSVAPPAAPPAPHPCHPGQSVYFMTAKQGGGRLFGGWLGCASELAQTAC